MEFKNPTLFTITCIVMFLFWCITLGFFRLTFKLRITQEERQWGGWGQNLLEKLHK